MSAIHRILFGVAVSLVVSMMPIGLAVSAPGPTSTRPPHQDQHGPIVTLHVRALVPEKVKLSDPTQGTVQATVLAVDEEINQITVQTDEGQRLMLFLDPVSSRACTSARYACSRSPMGRRRTPHDRQNTKGLSGKRQGDLPPAALLPWPTRRLASSGGRHQSTGALHPC